MNNSKETPITPNGSKKRSAEKELSLISSPISKLSPGNKKQRKGLEEQETLEENAMTLPQLDIQKMEKNVAPVFRFPLSDREDEEMEMVVGLCKNTYLEKHKKRVFRYHMKKGSDKMEEKSMAWTQLYEKDLVDGTAEFEDGREFHCKKTPKKGIPVLGTFAGFVDLEVEEDL